MVNIARNHRATGLTVWTTAGLRTVPVPPAGTSQSVVPSPPNRKPVPSPRPRHLPAGVGIALGSVFLDKAFGLGFATASERSWLNGDSSATPSRC
jgi:hypothetical protein